MTRHAPASAVHGNRRLGRRVAPRGLDVLWCLPGTVVGHRRESRRPPRAEVVDLSFTGMQVLSTPDARVQPGALVDVVIGGITTPVRVRWIGESDRRRKVRYGVEMVRPSSELTELLSRIVVDCDVRDGIELREMPVCRPIAWSSHAVGFDGASV